MCNVNHLLILLNSPFQKFTLFIMDNLEGKKSCIGRIYYSCHGLGNVADRFECIIHGVWSLELDISCAKLSFVK